MTRTAQALSSSSVREHSHVWLIHGNETQGSSSEMAMLCKQAATCWSSSAE